MTSCTNNGILIIKMNIIEKIVHPHICISIKRKKFTKNSTELFQKDVQPKTNKKKGP